VIHVEEATHPRSSKKSCENANVSIVFFSSWLSFRSLGSMASKFFRCHRHIVTSSARLGWSQGGFVVSEVSWIVRLEESSEVRGELFDVVFPLDFGRSDLALESAKMKNLLSH